jgi:hypothetical protein
LQHRNSNWIEKELGAYCCVCAGIAVLTIGVEMTADITAGQGEDLLSARLGGAPMLPAFCETISLKVRAGTPILHPAVADATVW